MPKFYVTGQVTYYVDVTVEAATPEEARRIFEEDLSLSDVKIFDGDSLQAREIQVNGKPVWRSDDVTGEDLS